MDRLFPALRRVERSYDKVFQTATLNRALHTAVREHAPASTRGRAVRMFYATQTGRRPPEITIFVTDPVAVSADYRRYLANRLTQVFGLSGVTLRIACRRRRAERGRPSRRRS
jgi:GTP-binding protein